MGLSGSLNGGYIAVPIMLPSVEVRVEAWDLGRRAPSEKFRVLELRVYGWDVKGLP